MASLSLTRLQQVIDRYEEVEARMGATSDSKEIITLSKEHSELRPVVAKARDLLAARKGLEEAEALASAGDAEMADLARMEIESLKDQLPALEQDMQILLLPKDVDDKANVVLEVRAGTGGDEAALFAGDLYRMYMRYAQLMGWKVEIVDVSEGEAGGYKEIIANVAGDGVFGRLKWESGVHRVQRVPATETQGRIHTSAATVAILPAPENIEIDIRQEDIRIDTMRASGAGGQHVNKTDSAVRITHFPSGIVVTSSEKSQHVNREKAMDQLKIRLYEKLRHERDSARAEARAGMVGTGDRSQKVRTYNYPENRVTDHRIGLTLYALDRIVAGGQAERCRRSSDHGRSGPQACRDGGRRLSVSSFEQLMRAAASRLTSAGIDDPRYDVQLLMMEAFGGGRADLISASTSAVPPDVKIRFEMAIDRRAQREPLQHIIGWTGFYGLEFRCDRRALIPRPDSECAVEVALALVPAKGALQIADLGTGSGCLLLALLANLPDAVGTGVEADPAAASLARENAVCLGLQDRAEIFEGAWSIWQGWTSADLIISNPPYIPSGDIAALAPEVKAFDPLAALDGGADGLAAYREIVRIGAGQMKRGTPLVLEIGHDQRAGVQALLKGAGFSDLGHRLDLGGNDRCVWGHAPGRAN